MANFNFGTDIPIGFDFYFGSITYTGTEVIFDFLISGYGYGVYDFNFGIAAKQLVIKSTATPGYVINSINIENINGNDVLYVNTVSGVVRVFSSTCTGTIGNRNIIDSDYVSGNCYAEIIWEGVGDKIIEVNTTSGTYDEFVLSGAVSCLLYYRF